MPKKNKKQPAQILVMPQARSPRHLPHAVPKMSYLSMRCLKCKTKVKYAGLHDSYFCPNCDEWMEPRCKDKDCEFCADRPERLE